MRLAWTPVFMFVIILLAIAAAITADALGAGG
jgi:hypothetical protein